MESDHGSRSSKHPRIREEASTVNSVDSEHSGGSRTSSETTRSEAIAPSTTGNYKSSDSLPSSSTEFYSDDFLQVDPLINPVSSATDDHKKSQENTKPPLRDGKYDVHSGPLFQIEEIFGSSSSASQFSEVTHESFIPSLSPTQSPPIQVMERGRGYDPDRIPASVFTKPSSPRDWSVASNESLFSIRIGNNSFSRDRNEIGKSGELDKSSELYRSGELKNSSELISFRQNSPVKRGGEHKIRNFDLGKTGAFEKTKESHPNRTIRDEGTKNLDKDNHLDKTGTNTFPIKKKTSKSSCICTSFSCKFCSCMWPCCSSCSCKFPSCSCQWPSCSSCSCQCPSVSSCSFKCPSSSCCCKRPSCSSCCCKWPRCPSCCCKWPNCSSSCCKWPNCSSGCCKWPSCSCKLPSCSNCFCKWPICSSCCCKWSSCSCKLPSCSSCCCKWPSCSSCCCERPCGSCKFLSWPSCSCKWSCLKSCCCKWPSCSGGCCKGTSGCCKSLIWPSCHCKCPSWSGCHCRCPSCSSCWC